MLIFAGFGVILALGVLLVGSAYLPMSAQLRQHDRQHGRRSPSPPLLVEPFVIYARYRARFAEHRWPSAPAWRFRIGGWLCAAAIVGLLITHRTH